MSRSTTQFLGGGGVGRFSSRDGRLSHVLLRDRLRGASEYLRIAGYFRSSIFELVHEEIATIGRVRIVCNADVDASDLRTSQLARASLLLDRWNQVDDELNTLLERPRYQLLYDLLRGGNVEVRVVAGRESPFVHGKAGVIRRTHAPPLAFMGSLNETREGWDGNYEIVWEDTSAEGIAWVESEFQALWAASVPLPSVIIDEIGRSASKRQVAVTELTPEEIAPSALVEAPIYRHGEELMPWQRAFVSLFLEHRARYGKVRLLLADEVGVGKTLSLAGSALVSSLLDDGPTLILCPATLCQQWQAELLDKLGIPSAVWLSAKKAWVDAKGHIIRNLRGAEDVARCPLQIGIVSTGLLFQPDSVERGALLRRSYGLLILDEAHRARSQGGIGARVGEPNRLMSFMQVAARKATHVLLATATPVQTDVAQLWDLLDILGQGADHVLGRTAPKGPWRKPEDAVPILTGQHIIATEDEVWRWLRDPLPSRHDDGLFDLIREDLEVPDTDVFTARSATDLESSTRQVLADRLEERTYGLTFLQHQNPLVRHVVLRRRSTLEDLGLLSRIAVDLWPAEGHALPMFDGGAVRTTPEFDAAYESTNQFTRLLAQRKKSAGFLRTLLLQRICSSYASGLATARNLLHNRSLPDGEDEQMALAGEVSELVDQEKIHLNEIISQLSARPTDAKLDAVIHYLIDYGWLELGCIVFSQYFDTAAWIAAQLSARLPTESVALYAGADKSCVYFESEPRKVRRDQIKQAVKERKVRLVVATDAACEGLNLQTLGTLINVDLPWNPSRLEQRIGRIKRFGQTRERVDMLNLVYSGTHDERIYSVLSKRMKDRYDLLGSLPDVIEDDWIDDIELLDAELSKFTAKRHTANAFDLRYGEPVDPAGPGWRQCQKVLARHDIVERLSRGWTAGPIRR